MKKKKNKNAIILAISIILFIISAIVAVWITLAKIDKANREKYSEAATNIYVDVKGCYSEKVSGKSYNNKYDLLIKFEIEGEKYESRMRFEDARYYTYEESVRKKTIFDGYEIEVFYEKGNTDKVYIVGTLKDSSGTRSSSMVIDAVKVK